MENSEQIHQAPTPESLPVTSESITINTSLSSTTTQSKRWIFIVIGIIVILGVSTVALSKFGLFDATDTKSSSLFGDSPECNGAYEQLMMRLQTNTSLCTEMEIRTGAFANVEAKEKATHIAVVFDSSGSMAAQIDNRSKIEIAKQETNKFISDLQGSGVELGLIVYGHKGNNSQDGKTVSCAGIEEVYPLGTTKSDTVISKFQSLTPTGWTPIASSLNIAKEMLQKKASAGDRNVILLISDGEETCEGDPVAMTRTIKQEWPEVVVNVIGFDVGGETENQLRAIAEAGDGEYSSAKNAHDLAFVFSQQENLMNKMDFTVGLGIEQLHDISTSVLKYNQCLMALNIEEARFMLSQEEEISNQCRSYAEEKYYDHYAEVKNKLREIFEREQIRFREITGTRE